MTVTALASPTGRPGYSETLLCAADSARTARALVRTALAAWELEDIAHDGALVVTELVANAVQHTNCRYIRVSVVRCGPKTVELSVVDKSRAQPHPSTPRVDDEHGRGLTLVDALTVRWGTELKCWGKSIWAELKSGDGL